MRACLLLAAVELSADVPVHATWGHPIVPLVTVNIAVAGRKAQGVTLAVAGIAVTWHPEAAYYVRLRHSSSDQPPAEEAAAMQAAVGQMLQGGDSTEQKVPDKVCFDLKGQLKALIVGEASAAASLPGVRAHLSQDRWDQNFRDHLLGKTARS